jgi:AmiR/NasT family two-component response regulator
MPLDLAGLRAFVVEDEALLLMTLEDMLADLGCQVIASARHVDEALPAAHDVAVDVALLDVNVAARRIPIVFVTGYEAHFLPQGIARSTRVGKPFQVAQLVRGLREVLAPRDGQ